MTLPDDDPAPPTPDAPAPQAPAAPASGGKPPLPRQTVVVLLLAGLLTVGLAVRDLSRRFAAPPPPPSELILRPTFETTIGVAEAGTAFVVRVEQVERPILLSALHLLSPDGGLPAAVPPTRLAEYVKAVTLRDAWDDSERGAAGEPIVIPGAALEGERGAGDVLAFYADEVRAASRPLATRAPGAGARVWLAAKLVGEDQESLHRAVVVESTSSWLVFRFDRPDIPLRATSGAPILNADDEVVAINLASYSEDGELYGGANPVGRFRGPLLEALR